MAVMNDDNDQRGPRLNRSRAGRPAAPERIIHLGVGNFSRAHQAWYTEHADDAREWGIAGFTGRGDRMVKALGPQDGLYTLITSNPRHDEFEVISSISSIHSGSDIAALRKRFSDPRTAVVTSTVTEAGYMRDDNGDLDTGNPLVASDLQVLADCHTTDKLSTVPGKMVSGLLARRQAQAGGITVLPCDNLSGNGAAFRLVVEQAIEQVDPTLLDWTHRYVSWATSMVDRITPATTDAERDVVQAAMGWQDAVPVRTEPFSEWVVSGTFPAGRPAWETAGAVFTDDIEPYEQRKLWMLNGSHCLLAYAGMLFGYNTVSEAIADPILRTWVNQWWDFAGGHLSIDSDAYRAKLLERFSNPRIHHQLAQIATDGSQKLPVRIATAARLALAQGESIVPPARALAAWVLSLRHGRDDQVHDVHKDELLREAAQSGEEALRRIVSRVDAELGASQVFLTEVEYQLGSVLQASQANAGN